MSFNEKTAWSAAFGVIVGLVTYFWLVSGQPGADGHLPMPSLTTLIIACVVSVLAVVIPILLLTALSSRAAAVPVDERDEIIIGRAGVTGHFVLQILLIVPLYLLFIGAPAPSVFHSLILVSSAAALIEYGGQIWRYRLTG